MKQTSENYVEAVLRTDCPITPELIARISEPQTVRLLHATIGMVTEAAELADMLKKHIFYGRPLDPVNAAEELGDNQWYVGLAIDVLKTTMNDILTMNIDKLRLRYPEKFNEADAHDRDIAAERLLLESSALTSKRGQDWIAFAEHVLAHIERYTVPQYGDKGEDQATDWDIPMLIEQTKKYANRFGKNQRAGQEILDFMKGAHYLQMAATRFTEEQSNETN